MVLQNASELVDALPDRHVVIFHGHRHLGYQGTLDGCADIVSAASSTLGDEGVEEDQRTPGFAVIDLACSSGGAHVSRFEHVSVS